MWELDYKESRTPKTWCFWTTVLEKNLESPLDCKEIKPASPKGNQSWVFIGRTDVEAETPVVWPPDANDWLIGKDPDAGKDWRQEEKGTTEDKMVGWHRWLHGNEFEQDPGVGDEQGSLALCTGCKELDMTEQLNWIDIYIWIILYSLNRISLFLVILVLLYNYRVLSFNLKYLFQPHLIEKKNYLYFLN